MKPFYTLILIGLAFFALHVKGQNLIPNGEFSLRDTTYCTDPVLGFEMVSDWYILGGLPYHFVKGCPIPEAFRGLGDSDQADYSGLSGHLTTRNIAGAQGIAVELTERLTAGQKYYLELSYINMGIRHQFDSLLRSCDTDPRQRVEVFFDSDSLPPVPELPDNPDFSMTEEEFYSTQTTSTWRALASCYGADGSESFIGFTLLRGEFDAAPPCEYDPRLGFYYHWHQFLVDRFILEPLPDTLKADFIICQNGRPVPFDASRQFDYRALRNISFLWEDGYEGPKRDLDQAGVYHLDAMLDCGRLPIEVTVGEKDCDPVVYMANAFSPNDDGVNESIRPNLTLEIPLDRYEWSVYDRWGRRVFLTNQEGDEWDGTRAGKPQPEGVYAWRLTFTVMREGRIRTYTRFGNITLIR